MASLESEIMKGVNLMSSVIKDTVTNNVMSLAGKGGVKLEHDELRKLVAIINMSVEQAVQNSSIQITKTCEKFEKKK